MTGTATHQLDVRTLPTFEAAGRTYRYVPIDAIGSGDSRSLPYSLRVLLENVLRTQGPVTAGYAEKLAGWGTTTTGSDEIPFTPARVLLQDMAGVPVLHDLVAMRAAVDRLGGDPARINPRIPAELVVDHSVIVDHFGSALALRQNIELEFERNRERYQFLRWAQSAFDNFRVVPPGVGIVHQVNIEHLARSVMTAEIDGELLAFPDTCVGTDSHTPMVNGLGVLGWGVGGIEAGAALLGQPLAMLVPTVVGVELVGVPPVGVTATDVVLTITELLRSHGVVGSIVEFHGRGIAELPVATRATIGNMSPEYGSTAAMFPIDEATLGYLAMTGRPREQVELVEQYAKTQGLWHDPDRAVRYSERLTLDLADVVPAIAGPRRPQDRVALTQAKEQFHVDLSSRATPAEPARVEVGGQRLVMAPGSLSIAAITSCTNTSNPTVMMSAALLARNTVERGLLVPPWVKTSMAPGSQVVTRYLERAGLQQYLDRLGFQSVGYGCTTCMGNSGPLVGELSRAAQEGLVLTSVLSGNRNFEGRVHPDVEMSYLASPPLVVAYALAGTMDIDLTSEPLGRDPDGACVYLRDLWPTTEEVDDALAGVVTRDLYLDAYADPFGGPPLWRELPVDDGDVFTFDERSTYLRRSRFFDAIDWKPAPLSDITDARALVVLGDSVTTDHISPVGAIRADSPAGRYLAEQGVAREDFNSYGSRRGNDEVMVRGTFANVRLRNRLLDGIQGGLTRNLLTGQTQSIFDAARAYAAAKVPLVVLAGQDYGSGSARDWAAKGTKLLGVRAVIAESFERIHRSNLVGMGILPLEYMPGQNATTLGLDGTERFTIGGIAPFGSGEHPRRASVVAASADASSVMRFEVTIRVDTSAEADYLRHGGVLPFLLRALTG